MTATVDALLAAIDAEPDDDARFLVLADVLIAAGDPVGELAIVQHELARSPHDRALRIAEAAHLPAAWGALARWRTWLWDVEWRLGFLDAIAVETPADTEVTDLLTAIAGARATRWLRRLQITMQAGRAFPGDPTPVCTLANLRKLLIIDGGGLADRHLHAFARMPRLEELTLGFCELSPAGIASIPTPARLRALRLRNAVGLGDDHVAATAQLPWLHRLAISGGGATDDGIARVGDAIRELGLVYCSQITTAVIEALAPRALDALELRTYDTFAGSALARLPHTLRRVHVGSIVDVEAAAAGLAEHAALEELALAGSFGDRAPVEASTAAAVMRLPALRRLKLRSIGALVGDGEVASSTLRRLELALGAVPRGWLARLAALPLVELDLDALPPKLNMWVDDDALAELAGLVGLEQLVLGQTQITDAGLAYLRPLARLTSLDVSECKRLSSRGLATVAELPALRSLDASLCHRIDSLAVLARHPALAELDLRATAIGDADLAVVGSLPSLRTLRASQTAVTDAGLAALLPKAELLERLDLAGCAITPRAVGVLRQLHRLAYLDVQKTGLDERALAELRTALPGCRIYGGP